MTKKRVSLATAATLILSTPFVLAQAKPSPYEGVSRPPANDSITTTEQAPAAPAPPVAVAPAPAPAAKSNPDAGIVEAPLPPPAVLQARNPEALADNTSDAGIVTYVPGPANALPEGTAFRVRIMEDIDAASTKAGTPFKAQVIQDIMRNGKVVVPVGSELHGRVVYATAGNRLNGGSVLHLRPDEFVLPDGTRYHLHAEVIETVGSDTKAKGEGNIVANEHGKRTIAELGMGAGSGAVLGAVVGGGVGAVVGTAVGAGVVTAHWLRTNWSANLPAQSTIVFSLTDPMFLTPAQDQKTELLPHSF